MASERDIAIWLFFRYRHPSRWYFSPVFVMYTVSPPPPLAAAAAAAAASGGGGDTVYITNTGEKYHRDGCRYLKKSQIAISRSDAIAQGYGACSVCNP